MKKAFQNRRHHHGGRGASNKRLLLLRHMPLVPVLLFLASCVVILFSLIAFQSQLFLTKTFAVPRSPLNDTTQLDFIKGMGLYAAVAYTGNVGFIATWSCPDYCQRQYVRNTENVTVIQDEMKTILAYVAQNNTTLVVVFRGTKSIMNAYDDIQFDPVEYRNPYNTSVASDPSGNPLFVHRGFLKSYNQVRDQVRDTITRRLGQPQKIDSVVFAGHSLGAAIATLATLDHCRALNSKQFKVLTNVSMVTFGSPRVGDAGLQKELADKESHHQCGIGNTALLLRVSQEDDIIAVLPPKGDDSKNWIIPPSMRNTSFVHVGRHRVISKDTCFTCAGDEQGECGDAPLGPWDFSRGMWRHVSFFEDSFFFLRPGFWI